MTMKTIKTDGIYYLEQVSAGSDWYWGEDYNSGDLYEAEELYKDKKSIKPNRLILVHCPDGEVIEPIKLTEGQYIGRPSLYYDHKVHVVMVDFTKQQIHLLSFNPDEILSGGSVNSLDILPLSCVEDCYNLMLKGTPVMLTRESYKQYFQILWCLEERDMNVGFHLEDHESFSHREDGKLYFSSWWETEDPEYEYHEEVIVRDLQGKILERFEGGIQEVRPGEYYVLQ